METFSTSYRPSVHGFRFTNGFRHQVLFDISTYGSCNGMAHVSLDYFFAGHPAPDIHLVDYGHDVRSGAAAVSWAAGRVDLLTRRHGDRIITRVYRDGAWTPWFTIGGNLTIDTPAAASWGPGRLDILYRDPGQRIMHFWFDGPDGALPARDRMPPNWADHVAIGLTDATPALATPAPGRLEAWVRGTDGQLWFTWGDAQPDGSMGWKPWAPLGTPPGVRLTSGFAAASRLGWMTGFVRGSDGACWQREWARGGWQPWTSLGGALTSGPAACSSAPGRLEVCVRGTDGKLYLKALADGRWSAWTSLEAPPPGATEDPPALIGSPGFVGVFVRAHDGTVWHRRLTGGGWEPTDPPISAASRRLTDAIYHRMMASTHNRLLGLGAATLLTGGLAAAFAPVVGPAIDYVFWPPRSDEELWGWSRRDELGKICESLKRGRPIPVGLLDGRGGWGHEVVAYEATVGVAPGPGGRPGNAPGVDQYVRIYDPNHPGCDDLWLHYDEQRRAIVETPGEVWRGAFARTDYTAEPPPL